MRMRQLAFSFILLLSCFNIATQAFSVLQSPILSLDLCPNPVYRSTEWMKQFINGLKEKTSDFDTMQYLRNNISTDSHIISTAQVTQILEQIQFDSSKLLGLGLLNPYIMGLSGDQIVSILDSFSLSSMKIDALEQIATTLNRPYSNDRQTIVEAFKIESDQEKASQILDNIVPRNCIFGTVAEETVTFIIDTSYSMGSVTTLQLQRKVISRLAYLKFNLNKLIGEQLKPSQKFNIIVLSTSVIQWQSDYVYATLDNIKGAIDYINQLTANGTTTILEGLDVAFNTKGDLNAIYLASDYVPTASVPTAEGFQKYLADKNSGKAEKVVINTVSLMFGGQESIMARVESFKILNAIAESTNGSFRGFSDVM